MALVFPVADLMDPAACLKFFESAFWPGGPACPRCGRKDRVTTHSLRRPEVPHLRCGACRRVFNVFTGTILQGSRRTPAELVLILRGVLQGVTTMQLSKELGCSYNRLLDLRHKLQDSVLAHNIESSPRLSGAVFEADEMYQNAGEKRRPPREGRGPARAPAREQGARPRHVRQ